MILHIIDEEFMEKDREKTKEYIKEEAAYIVSELMFNQLMKQPEHIRSKVYEMLLEHLKPRKEKE